MPRSTDAPTAAPAGAEQGEDLQPQRLPGGGSSGAAPVLPKADLPQPRPKDAGQAQPAAQARRRRPPRRAPARRHE